MFTFLKHKTTILLSAYLVFSGISNTLASDVNSIFWDNTFYTLEFGILIYALTIGIEKTKKLELITRLGVITYKVIVLFSLYFSAYISNGNYDMYCNLLISNKSCIIATPSITLILYSIIYFYRKFKI